MLRWITWSLGRGSLLGCECRPITHRGFLEGWNLFPMGLCRVPKRPPLSTRAPCTRPQGLGAEPQALVALPKVLRALPRVAVAEYKAALYASPKPCGSAPTPLYSAQSGRGSIQSRHVLVPKVLWLCPDAFGLCTKHPQHGHKPLVICPIPLRFCPKVRRGCPPDYTLLGLPGLRLKGSS